MKKLTTYTFGRIHVLICGFNFTIQKYVDMHLISRSHALDYIQHTAWKTVLTAAYNNHVSGQPAQKSPC